MKNAIFAIIVIASFIFSPIEAQTRKQLKQQVAATKAENAKLQQNLSGLESRLNQQEADKQYNEYYQEQTQPTTQPRSSSELILYRDQQEQEMAKVDPVAEAEKALAIAKAEAEFQANLKKAAEKKEAKLKALESKSSSSPAPEPKKPLKGNPQFDFVNKTVTYVVSDTNLIKQISVDSDWKEIKKPR